jgi:ATP-binding cassette, subfamily F, member 3
MLVLSVQNITKYFSDEPVLAGASFELRRGEHVSLVGPNGAGKSTLLKILTGELDADSGQVEIPKKVSFGYLKQYLDADYATTVWQFAHSAMQHISDMIHESESLSRQMGATSDPDQLARLGERYDRLQTDLTQRNAFSIDYKIEKVLDGLQFGTDVYQQPIGQLSGGQQNRLMLAKLLLEEPDVMLLDEPSNHLDIQSTEWLESFLIDSKQAFILVSHDRFFLDRVARRTLELFHGTVDDYPGNYTKYLELKQQRLEVQRKTYEKQQVEIEKLEDFVRRHHYGQKHAQAEDRRKKLERIELVDLPREIETPKMGFPPAAYCGDIALRVESISKAFDKSLFENLSFQIERGQRWGIVGPNGCGKTTLLKCLTQEIQPDSGSVKWGTGVKPGYFDQHLASVDPEAEAYEAIRPPGKEMVDQQRRDLLARFGVTGELALQKVKSMSGGERNRVALARLAAHDPNFLVLDEPTNHLDLWARQALESAMKKFDGTLLVVSHDRYFINQVCDHLIVFDGPNVRLIDGNYDTFQLIYRRAESNQNVADNGAESRKQKSQSKPTESKRKRKFPYRKLEDIEKEIARRESAVEAFHDKLADPDILRDKQKTLETQNSLAAEKEALASLYEHWDEAIELGG